VPNGSSGTFATLGQLPRLDPNYPDYLVSVGPVAQSISSAGQVVGNQQETYVGEGGNSVVLRAMRWVNGVPQELPLATATAINDAGQIVGTHTRSGNAALLTEESLVLPLLTIEGGATATEGHSGTTNALFTVRLSRPSSQTVTVDYATTNVSAAAGSDYLATSGTLTFTPGQTNKTLPVQVVGDREFEYFEPDFGHERFYVTLGNSGNAIADRTPALGIISDDEPRISSDRATVVEGNSGSEEVLVTVRLSSAYDQAVTVDYATGDDSATAGSDYLATSGTVTFAPGQTTRQFPVIILGDRVPEYSVEYFSILLSNPSDNAGVEEWGSLGVNIEDDEPLLSITPGVAVSEGNAGTTDAVFTVSLSAPYDQDVTVEYLTSDPYEVETDWAAAGSDYAVASGTLRIPAGQTSGTVRVAVIGDTLDENDEYFALDLANPSGNAWIGDATHFGFYGVGVIRDDDGPAKTWVGPASGGNWSTAANWSPGGVPAASDHVAIAGKSVNLSGSATVASLSLSGGATLSVGVNGSRILRTSGLSIGDDSTLNLNDNDLIIDYTGGTAASPIGSWNGSAYTGVTGLIARGYNFSAWDGNALVTTTANARAGLTTLAPAEAGTSLGITGNQTATWNGQTIDGTTVIVKYTYAGDLNLDGRVDAQDYGIIDNWVQVPGASGYANGDINYDGVIDAVDYGIVDNTIQLQGPPISPVITAAADEPIMQAYLPLRFTHANHDPVDREEVEASLVAVAMDATSR
jgi:hypothetical protein